MLENVDVSQYRPAICSGLARLLCGDPASGPTRYLVESDTPPDVDVRLTIGVVAGVGDARRRPKAPAMLRHEINLLLFNGISQSIDIN